VTSNFIADTVVALYSFSRFGDWYANPLRLSLQALNAQIARTVRRGSRSHPEAVRLMNRVHDLVADLQRREMNHLVVMFTDGQNHLLPVQRADLDRFAAQVAEQARASSHLRPGLVVRVQGPGGGAVPGWLFRSAASARGRP
jgi:hypothetical protein